MIDLHELHAAGKIGLEDSRVATPRANPQYDIADPNVRVVPISQIKTEAKVVFIGACYSGSVF